MLRRLGKKEMYVKYCLKKGLVGFRNLDLIL